MRYKKDGGTVLLVDADPQGSARDWHEANGGEVLNVVGLDRETLERDIEVGAALEGYGVPVFKSGIGQLKELFGRHRCSGLCSRELSVRSTVRQRLVSSGSPISG